jgi:hypothetical protein
MSDEFWLEALICVRRRKRTRIHVIKRRANWNGIELSIYVSIVIDYLVTFTRGLLARHLPMTANLMATGGALLGAPGISLSFLSSPCVACPPVRLWTFYPPHRPLIFFL